MLSEPPALLKEGPEQHGEQDEDQRRTQMRLFSLALKRRISQPRYTSVAGPMMYMNMSV
jgi:hypothetical protein